MDAPHAGQRGPPGPRRGRHEGRLADQLGLQLLFTAAPKDKGALSMFDRTIALARKTRPSSKEKVVVIDDHAREINGLLLIQKDVAAVLGR